MKLLIASDIHGDLESLELVFKAFKEEGCERILFLGDLLYHGPRNDLPKTYAPKAVIELLNANREVIMSVRGNCDTEVDQMVLNFPILADYALIDLSGVTVFLTHGHKHNLASLPPLKAGDILLHGHTHVPACEAHGGITYLNPGSVSIPKEGSAHSYMVLEGGTFTCKSLAGDVLFRFSSQ